MGRNNSDGLFHPLIDRWFEARIGRPTRIHSLTPPQAAGNALAIAVQEKAWHLIASNAHVIVTAPTGSGKTLAGYCIFVCRSIMIGRRTALGGATTCWTAAPIRCDPSL